MCPHPSVLYVTDYLGLESLLFLTVASKYDHVPFGCDHICGLWVISLSPYANCSLGCSVAAVLQLKCITSVFYMVCVCVCVCMCVSPSRFEAGQRYHTQNKHQYQANYVLFMLKKLKSVKTYFFAQSKVMCHTLLCWCPRYYAWCPRYYAGVHAIMLVSTLLCWCPRYYAGAHAIMLVPTVPTLLCWCPRISPACRHISTGWVMLGPGLAMYYNVCLIHFSAATASIHCQLAYLTIEWAWNTHLPSLPLSECNAHACLQALLKGLVTLSHVNQTAHLSTSLQHLQHAHSCGSRFDWQDSRWVWSHFHDNWHHPTRSHQHHWGSQKLGQQQLKNRLLYNFSQFLTNMYVCHVLKKQTRKQTNKQLQTNEQTKTNKQTNKPPIPNCLQATWASVTSQRSSHTVPQAWL